MIYNGQEAGNDKRLAFSNETQSNGKSTLSVIYINYLTKHNNEACGMANLAPHACTNTAPKQVLSFVRAVTIKYLLCSTYRKSVKQLTLTSHCF